LREGSRGHSNLIAGYLGPFTLLTQVLAGVLPGLLLSAAKIKERVSLPPRGELNLQPNS
jgi:hypothetical protein